jgi:hypothetical protein
MAHYAFLDDNNIVTQVIVGRDEDEVVDGITDWETYYGNFQGQTCKRTSYNTAGGTHLLGGTPFRKNYAGIGMVYDSVRDAFYGVQPFPSWVLDEDTCLWDAPVAYPDDGLMYNWDEASQSWQEVTDGL